MVQEVLQDYALTCSVEVFDGKVIITDNMTEVYTELRRDLVENEARDLSDIHKFHGLTVQPLELNGNFTILLNKNYIVESINKRNYNICKLKADDSMYKINIFTDHRNYTQ